ncbi:FAD-binding oxidoreductase [Actinoplanes sp. NPDC051494]|uniref:FAD-binding oxidoreductase n=1 Tax=Actinoplanes sp. NPDC051494 TaxID=3363907 RepID=UPI0037904BF3
MSPSRRTLIRAGAALPLAGLPEQGGGLPEQGGGLPEQGGGMPEQGGGLPARGAGRPGRGAGPDWTALAAAVDGAVVLPGTGAYDDARRLVDPRFDGVRPPAVVRCAHGGDVAEAIRFARRSRLPVITRGGGHSYVGASTGTGSIVLDLRALDAVSYDTGSRTATIGGGARLMEVYTTLGAARVSVPSGSCGSVGIGGITLGGGVGMASSAYGLTCDAVVGANLVTADGVLRGVHAGREPELFWALRGGGGGQFGVVTGWRMRTHPATTAGTFKLSFRWADAARVAAGWQARLATAPDETWSTCQFTSDAKGRLGVRVSGFVLDGRADAEAAAIVAAIGRDPSAATLDRRPYLDVVRDRAGCDDTASCAVRSTELVGSEVFSAVVPPAGIAALLAVVERRARARRPGVAKFKRMTGAQSRVAVDATAFPWRGVRTMLQWLVESPTADAAAARDAYAWIDGGHRAMARWSAGRYVNYLEPDPAALPRYHGRHLARLRRVRAAADPQRLFRSAYAL